MRLSAIRLPLSAGLYSRKHGDIQTSDFPPSICHPERSEGSRCKALVSLSLVNTGRREDIRLSDGRHQTYIHYSRMQGGSGACGVRVQAAAVASPLDASGSAHRAGRFRGSYVVSLRWRGRCILESKRGAPAFGGQGLSPALSRGPKVV